MTSKLSISCARKEAEKFNGKCLSKTYSGHKAKMKWKCCNGHIFERSMNDVRHKDLWCPKCNSINISEEYCRHIFEKIFDCEFLKTRKILKDKLELDGYNENLSLAFEYQGEQHYKYVPKIKNTKLDIEDIKKTDKKKKNICKKMGIKLICIPFYEAKTLDSLYSFIVKSLDKLNIEYGKKGKIDYSDMFFVRKNWLDIAQDIAKKRNGRLLSKTYYNNSSKLKWKCINNHIWESSLNSVKDSESWCPYCSGQLSDFIGDAKKIAKERSGFCLSKKCVNARTNLKWMCKNGHIFFAKLDNVKKGKWCSICHKETKGKRRKNTIDDFKSIALSKGGICLSEKYINSIGYLDFRCSKGHTWSAKAYQIKTGTWCKKCFVESKKSKWKK